MAPITKLTCLGLIMSTFSNNTIAATTPAAGLRAAQGMLEETDTKSSAVTMTSSKVPLFGVFDSSYEIVAPASEDYPGDTRIRIDGDGTITTLSVGPKLYKVAYDGNDEISGVTLVSEGATTRRAQQVVDAPDRRLQATCDDCVSIYTEACGDLTAGCADPASGFAQEPGFCDNVQFVCGQDRSAEVCDLACAARLAGECINGLPGVDGWNSAGLVCCPSGCGSCGGSGCAKRGLPDFDGSDCCIGRILEANIDCAVAGSAPCIVAP